MAKRPATEKPWDKLDAADRLERMREQIKALQEDVSLLHWQMAKIVWHSHHDGKVVVPFHPDHDRAWNPGTYF